MIFVNRSTKNFFIILIIEIVFKNKSKYNTYTILYISLNIISPSFKCVKNTLVNISHCAKNQTKLKGNNPLNKI